MSESRRYVLSIAGFDPSAGAGLLADIKTMEQHGVYGLGACSALTIQDDSTVFETEWISTEQIIRQIRPLTEKFTLAACKIGIVESMSSLQTLVDFLHHHNPAIKIVLDPVLRATSGFVFHKVLSIKLLHQVLTKIALITPNYTELIQLREYSDLTFSPEDLSMHCPVLLKGGHNPHMPGTDILYINGQAAEIAAGVAAVFQKHGSGCVLSAAIAANLAKGMALPDACAKAKTYTEKFLNSNPALLGYHAAL